MTDMLKPNQIIDIVTEGDSPFHFQGLIKVASEDRIFVQLCADPGKPVDLSPGISVRVGFADRTAIYWGFSKILSVNNGTPVLFTLSKLEDFQRIQRRDFVRLDVKLKSTFSLLDENMTPVQTFDAVIRDLSGGGIRFGCNVLLSLGQILSAKISLEASQTVTGVGEVVRVTENSAASRYRYTVGFKFTVIKEADRDKIIRFIFDEQRRLRKKGLL